jgi:hypothetical protein
MTSPRQLKANRLNALVSTGPRTMAGKRHSSVNALRHGLTVPVELSAWAPHEFNLRQLLAAEGLSDECVAELARLILDYERNVAQHRSAFLQLTKGSGVSHGVDFPNPNQSGGYDGRPVGLGLANDSPHAKVDDFGMVRLMARLNKKRGRGSLGSEAKAQTGLLRTESRYLKRAANQLVRYCKRLSSGLQSP